VWMNLPKPQGYFPNLKISKTLDLLRW
jgi:hypothetical protein